jgi:mannose/cellobiose epimerase-like protein (N-acyl-D-glucosamine 2-epimerase family)
MHWQPPEPLTIDDRLYEFIEKYRANYLRFFLDYFRANRRPGYRGGYFNLNSVTGQPYDHHCCYSWADGRSLAELSISHLLDLDHRQVLKDYATHLRKALVERYELNGYLPHAVDDATNRATDDPWNMPLNPEQSSFSHIFAMNGFFQYALIFGDERASEVGASLLDGLESALRTGEFIEGAEPRPKGDRAQGPFMIALGAIADILETLEMLHERESAEFAEKAKRFIELGRECVQYILGNHHRPEDNAFWEVSRDGEPVRDEEGRVITDPGHTIEFTAFAARFAAFLPADEGQSLLQTSRDILLWAATRGFHPTRHLICKHIDRDTLQPIANDYVESIADKVPPAVAEEHFAGETEPVWIVTYPWWPLMELLAAGSILRRIDRGGEVDALMLRAVRGIFEYYQNERIDGLCYQNIGDGFFDYINVPPATPTLDLMHSHRSLRVFVREM